jgi:hexosaminidase
LDTLSVAVDDHSEAPPQHGFDESYTLTVSFSNSNINSSSSSSSSSSGGVVSKQPVATLTAVTLYGALRGLETFSQLVHFNYTSSIYTVSPITISDSPRFPHRGFMVDTARHFQSIAMLRRLLDSMYGARFPVEVYTRGMPLSFTPLLRLKLEHACDQCHSSRVFTPLTGWHRNNVRFQTLKSC